MSKHNWSQLGELCAAMPKGRCAYHDRTTIEAPTMRDAITQAEQAANIGPWRIGGIFELEFYLQRKTAIDRFFAGDAMSGKIAP